MGMLPMGLMRKPSASVYEGPIVGRVTFSPLDSSAGREAVQQRDRVFERVNAHQVATIGASDAQPNPERFTVLRAVEAERHLVALVRYPDCTTYEGRKILVFAETRQYDLAAATVLDPHFTDKAPAGALVPVARFEPTERGWRLAMLCAWAL